MSKLNIKQLLAMGCFAIVPYTSWAQGIIVHKTDGSQIKFKATEVESITTYADEGATGGHKKLSITVGGTAVTFNMIFVEGGEFDMGATSEQGDDVGYYETPVHKVRLNDYYIGETEVTQELWIAIMDYNPSWNQNNLLYPMQCASWESCQEFVNKLSIATGYTFRLPTEAEWEYAARGGNSSKKFKYAGSNDIDNVAWYSNNSGDAVHEVAAKEPNELGIYDMSGNVWEWCQDWYGEYGTYGSNNPTGPSSGSFKIFRGGAYTEVKENCRTTTRAFNKPDFTYGYLGLRLAMNID